MYKTLISIIENSFSNIRKKRSLYVRRKRFIIKAKNIVNHNNLLKGDIKRTYNSSIQRYWKKHYGKRINLLWHTVISKVIGVENVRYIPHYLWKVEILPFFNNFSMQQTYMDKNLFNKLINCPDAPKTIIKRMHGQYYDEYNNCISRSVARELVFTDKKDKIIKPSHTNDGYKIKLFNTSGGSIILDERKSTFEEIESEYGLNYIIQERIEQHQLMAQVHPESVNTIRMVTFRWKEAIHILLAFARFGVGKKITDNAGTGGVCCGINENGLLNPTAVDMWGRKHDYHPTSGFDFNNRLMIPNYNKICRYARELHKQVFHFDIISWDIAVGNNTDLIVLEMNFMGASYVYQFACEQPIFGDMTEEVLEKVRESNYKDSRKR